MWRIVLLALVGLACYRPQARDCVIHCGEGAACPEGASCSYGLCTTGPACGTDPVAAICDDCSQETGGAASCRGDAVLHCELASWKQAPACAGAQPVCFEGACRLCRPGHTRCAAGCLETCAGTDGWQTSPGCAACPSPPSSRLIAAGWSHTCAIFDGAVHCWGANSLGQLGLENTSPRDAVPGSMTDPPARADLGVDRRATAIVAGGRHTCVLLDTGGIKCWGDNGHGQLGLGDRGHRGDQPGEMGDLLATVDLEGHAVSALAAGGQHTCVVLDDGRVKCWGDNTFGQLGTGDNRDRGSGPCEMGGRLPAVDLGGALATSVEAGAAHTCALLADGTARCWGANNTAQLGLGTTSSNAPVPGAPDFVEGPELVATPIRALAAGNDHTCALFDGGAIRCWGSGAAGQTGRGSGLLRLNPLLLGDLPLDAAVAIVTGAAHTCALLASGQVKCWGLNTLGQLGLEDTDNRSDDANETVDALPFVLLGTSAAASLAAGGDHTCALLATGRLKCWGENTSGQLGLGDKNHRGDQEREMGGDLPEVPLPGMVVGP